MNIANWTLERSLVEGLLLSVMAMATVLACFLLTLHFYFKQRALKWAGDSTCLDVKKKEAHFRREIFMKRAFNQQIPTVKRLEIKAALLLKALFKWHEKRLVISGVEGSQALRLAWKWCVAISGIFILVLMSDLRHPLKAVGVFMGLSAYFGIATHFKIKERKHIFVTGVYKIYRHMGLQLTAGMPSTEVIKHLHESVEEPFLKEAMFGFSSCYFKTMDLELAAEELTRRIEGDEIQVLATVLRQGLQTGDHYEMVVKQEQLMVKRYYAALAAESEQIRVKGIGIAIALCLLVFLLLAVPMVYEMGRATQSIFSGQ